LALALLLALALFFAWREFKDFLVGKTALVVRRSTLFLSLTDFLFSAIVMMRYGNVFDILDSDASKGIRVARGGV